MSLLDVMGIVVVVVLVFFLNRRHETRIFRRTCEREWPGHGMDVGPVSVRIERVRRNFPAAARARPHDLHRRLRLHELAGQAIRRFAYFRNVETEDSRAGTRQTNSTATR